MEEDKKRPEIEDMVPAVFTLPDGTTQQAEERRCRVCGRISHYGDKWCVCRCKRCWQHADPALSKGCDCDAKIREAEDALHRAHVLAFISDEDNYDNRWAGPVVLPGRADVIDPELLIYTVGDVEWQEYMISTPEELETFCEGHSIPAVVRVAIPDQLLVMDAVEERILDMLGEHTGVDYMEGHLDETSMVALRGAIRAFQEANKERMTSYRAGRLVHTRDWMERCRAARVIELQEAWDALMKRRPCALCSRQKSHPSEGCAKCFLNERLGMMFEHVDAPAVRGG